MVTEGLSDTVPSTGGTEMLCGEEESRTGSFRAVRGKRERGQKQYGRWEELLFCISQAIKRGLASVHTVLKPRPERAAIERKHPKANGNWAGSQSWQGFMARPRRSQMLTASCPKTATLDLGTHCPSALGDFRAHLEGGHSGPCV